MSEIKLKRIISFSSEDPVFKAENLLNCQKWIGSNAGETKQSVVIEVNFQISFKRLSTLLIFKKFLVRRAQ